jgi:Domain of unknown function (DUF4249)
MRLFIVSAIIAFFVSCDKVIEVKLPAYEPEIVVEMYLHPGQPLRCLLIESLPYTDTAINKPVKDAVIIFSDGLRNDTLTYEINQDKLTGRFYNYFNPKIVARDSTKTYTLTVFTKTQKITARTAFSESIAKIDSVLVKESLNEKDSFSVGVAISDPESLANYYRVLIGKQFNFFGEEITDLRTNDVAFNGKSFSFFSEPDFAKNDTVTVRVYSLHRDHFNYLESVGNARRSNFNPFSQPSLIKSNITGGLGIFTTIRYTERKIVIR